MDASIRKVTKDVVTLDLGIDELRTLLYVLAPVGSPVEKCAMEFLPKDYTVLRREMFDLLRRLHDNSDLER